MNLNSLSFSCLTTDSGRLDVHSLIDLSMLCSQKLSIKVSEDLSYKIDVIVDMLDAVRAYITLSTAHLLNMKVEKDDTQVQ